MKRTASLLLFLVLPGCGTEASAPPARAGDPSARAEGEQAFLRGDYAEAAERFSLAAEAGDAEAAVWQGRALMKLENWSQAERAFRASLRLPGEPGWQARLGQADALLVLGRPEEAAKALRTLADDPRALKTLEPALVLYKTAVAEMRCGNWEEAGTRLREVSRTWPGTPWAVQADERRADVLDRRFSVQLGVYAQSEAADKRITELRSAGIAASSIPVRRGGADLFAVRGGTFATYREAVSETVRLKGLGEDGVVVP